MRNQANWSKGILTWGLVLAALGLVLVLAGPILQNYLGLGRSGKIITGSGIFLLVLGIVSLGQYAYAWHNPKAGQHMMIEERDERLQFIRARAGQRAYGVSSALAFMVLMWASFAGEAGVPPFSHDALWIALVVVVVVPSIAYSAWIIYGQSKS